jgi:hypothetical protein
MTTFKAEREVKSYTMHLVGPPADVFPLLCPVREYDWIEPWQCDMVFSAGGVAENNAIFTTAFPAQGGDEIWVVCRYETNRAIEFIRVSPGLKVNRLDLALTAVADGTLAAFAVRDYLAEKRRGGEGRERAPRPGSQPRSEG